MPIPLSCAAKVFCENHGNQREFGTERTSATVVTAASCSIAAKRAAGMLEWPMLKRSNGMSDIDPTGPAISWQRLFGRRIVRAINSQTAARFTFPARHRDNQTCEEKDWG